MGRPKIFTEPRITTGVRMPEDLMQRLRKEARTRDISVNHLIVKATAYYLDRLPPIDAVDEIDTHETAGV